MSCGKFNIILFLHIFFGRSYNFRVLIFEVNLCDLELVMTF